MSEAGWGTVSGLEDRYSGPVTDAYFDTNNSGGTTLKLTVNAGGDIGEIENFYGCGKKAPLISPNEVDVSDLKNHMFNESSGIGRLIDTLIETGLIEQIQKQGPPNIAKSWIGLNCTWIRHESEGTGSDGKPFKWQIMLPETEADRADAGGGETAASSEPATYPDEIVKLVTNCDSYDDFQEKALDLDVVKNDKKLRRAILDESLWEF